jgi:hypothetical protein
MEVMDYPHITSMLLLSATPAIFGFYFCIVFTLRAWVPDNVVILTLGFTPLIFVAIQLYQFVSLPLLPTYEQKHERCGSPEAIAGIVVQS